MAKRKKKKKGSKILTYLVAAVLLISAGFLSFGVLSQVIENLQLRSQESEVTARLEELEAINAQLQAEKTKLEDPEYIATYARGEYLFSKNDEKVFLLPSVSASPEPTAESGDVENDQLEQTESENDENNEG